jgi:amino acid permease
LALPAGIAAFGTASSAAVPAVALIAAIGVLSGYGFGLIGRVCCLTNTTSFRDAWSASIGPKTSWIPALSVTLKTFCAVLAYSMILADTFQSLAVTAGFALSKQAILLTITGALLFPLCLLKNLSSLAPFSLLGTLGMVYTAIAMAIRYFGKAYVGSGRFATDLPSALRPAFGTVGAAGVWNPATSILVGMLSTAYMAHFNAPKFYTELKDNTVPRYLKVVSTSFGIAIFLFSAMAALGFLTFGANSAGLILNNYSNADTLMGISRIAVALSIVFSYPLAFTGARDGVLDLFKIKQRSNGFLNALTAGMLSAITAAALVIPDVSFVLAFAGATLGNCLIYIFPALMFRGAIRKQENPTKLQKIEVKVALTSAVLGLGMGALGAFKAVQKIL